MRHKIERNLNSHGRTMGVHADASYKACSYPIKTNVMSLAAENLQVEGMGKMALKSWRRDGMCMAIERVGFRRQIIAGIVSRLDI